MPTWKPEQTLPQGFLDIAKHVYANDPNWLPENEAQIRKSFGLDNHYFATNRACLQVIDGKARLAGFYNPSLLIDDKRVAYFGYWETVHDLASNQALFAAFEDWAKAQGAEVLYGPVNFTTFQSYRMRLNCFDDGCFPGEPYNPDYYPQLLSQLGYDVAKRYFSWVQSHVNVIDDFRPMFEPELARVQEMGFQVKPLTKDYWVNNLATLYDYIDEIFQDNFGYTGISLEDFQRDYGETLARRLCPYSSHYILDPEGALVGFFFSFPDYAPLLRQGAAHRIDPADLSFDEHFPLLPDPCVLGKTAGVNPRYRQQGIYTLLSYLAARGADGRYTRAVCSLIREDNPSIRFAQLGFSRPDTVRREYALFTKTVA